MEGSGEVTKKPKRQPVYCKINDLKPGTHGYNVYVRVESVTHSESTRQDGTKLKIAEAVVGDDSGIVQARIVGAFADLIQPGKVIAIRNGRSEVFKEHMRLEVDRWGKITAEEDSKVTTLKKENDLSKVAYEMKYISTKNK